jgi:hypothetical protein
MRTMAELDTRAVNKDWVLDWLAVGHQPVGARGVQQLAVVVGDDVGEPPSARRDQVGPDDSTRPVWGGRFAET